MNDFEIFDIYPLSDVETMSDTEEGFLDSRWPGTTDKATATRQQGNGSETFQKPRLSGAARRRLRWLLIQGMGYDEAVRACCGPGRDRTDPTPSTSPGSRAVKRTHSEEESPEPQPRKATRVNNVGPTPTYGLVARSLRVGVQNTTPMSGEQMGMIHRAIVVLLSKSEKGLGVRFRGFSHRPGWVLITCNDEKSKDWLVREIPNLKPWPEADLSIMDQYDLPKHKVVTAYLPKSEAASVEQALTLLGVQNKGLKTDLWKVFGSKEDGGGFLLVASVDDSSFEALSQAGRKATLGFKTVVFKFKGDNKARTRDALLPAPETSAVGAAQERQEPSWAGRPCEGG